MIDSRVYVFSTVLENIQSIYLTMLVGERNGRFGGWKIWPNGDKDVERWRAISDWKRFRSGRSRSACRDNEISVEQLQKRKWHDLILGSPRIGP